MASSACIYVLHIHKPHCLDTDAAGLHVLFTPCAKRHSRFLYVKTAVCCRKREANTLSPTDIHTEAPISFVVVQVMVEKGFGTFQLLYHRSS